MKNIKKLIAIVLAVALCMGLGAPAIAGGEPNPHGGPCYIIDEMYYPMDLDDAGEGWYYTAATRTLTIENFTCEAFGLYAYYEAENLYVEMVGDNNLCTGDARSECYPLEEDIDGGAIYFIGDGSITVEGDLRGPRFGFHSGTVTAGDISSGWGGKPIAVYEGATLNIVDSGYICSFDVYGGVINFVSQYSSRMAASDKSYLVHAGTVTVTNTSGNDALHVDEEAYAQVIGGGATFTSGDGAEVFHNTEGSINRVRLVSDPDNKLSDVVITGSGAPTAAPERPTGMTDNTPGASTEEKPDGSQSTDTSGSQTGGIDSGSLLDFVDMATEMGLDLSDVSVEMVHMYAAELGFDLSGYSDEELAAILTELAMVQDAESGESDKPAIVSELAIANKQTVLVDGSHVEFEVYALEDENGGETNYIKLRDLAFMLNGTAAQFEVSWDGAVNIITGQSYTQNGTEMDTPFEGDREYRPTDAVTKVNGVVTEFDAICLEDDDGGEYNYYKLRDLGKALGFDVSWSYEQGIFIETDQPYTDD